MKYARLTQQALSENQSGWNPVMRKLAQEIEDGTQENLFTYKRDEEDNSTQLYHPYFAGKDSVGHLLPTIKMVGWWYHPEQWEDIGLESEAEEL